MQSLVFNKVIFNVEIAILSTSRSLEWVIELDIDIYFADPGTPSQRGLNENSNGLLRKDGLPKQMDFNEVDESFIQSIASKRNNIPRKSLNYKTPIEVFLSHICKEELSNLIWQLIKIKKVKKFQVSYLFVFSS